MAELLPLPDAIERLVHDGDCVAMEGFTHLIPHGAGHEIIHPGRRRLTLVRLTLVRLTPDVIFDQLIGMGCAAKLVFSWGGERGCLLPSRSKSTATPGRRLLGARQRLLPAMGRHQWRPGHIPGLDGQPRDGGHGSPVTLTDVRRGPIPRPRW